MAKHVDRADRVKTAAAIVGSFLLVLALGLAGWVLVRSESDATNPVAGSPTDNGNTSAPAETPGVTATPTTTPPAKAKPKAPPTKKPTARPVPPRKPPAKERPPAPKPRPKPSPGCKPTYNGEPAPLPEVKVALVTAGARQYWQGTQRPKDLVGPLPKITVPANLMKAIAWQESGWQSTIMACDGGIGTMQVMPDTVTTVNNRFGTNFNVNTLAGNTDLGAAYLEWNVMYFGLYYFGSLGIVDSSGSVDLSVTAPVGEGGATMRLLDVVVAAYNVGPYALEDLKGTEDSSDDTLSIPNTSYVNNVVALMDNCECLAY